MLTACLLAFLLLALALVWIRRPQRPPGFPPGPAPFLIFGNIGFVNETVKGNFRSVLAKCRQEFGDIIGILLPTGQRAVHLVNFNDIKGACGMHEFSGRPNLFVSLVRSHQQKLGIIFNEGSHWVEHRRFALRHLRDLGFGKNSMEDIVLNEFELLAEDMKRDIGAPMKVNDRLNFTVLNVLWQLVAGQRLDNNDPKSLKYLDTVNEFIATVGPRSPLNLAPWLRHLFPERSGYAALIRHRETTAVMFNELVRQHRQSLDRASPRDFIDQFLIEMESPDAEARQFNEHNLGIIGMDFFLAGMETSSTTLHWALLLMVMYPEVQAGVQSEIASVLGGRPPSYSDRSSMPYTEATLMEVTRRTTAVPQSVPHSALSAATFRGYDIPKDTILYMHVQEVHMDPKHWGDPEAFRPERFLDADGGVRHDERLIPFGIGKRFCLGETLARMEVFVLFVCLLQRFAFTAAPGQTLSLDTKFGVVQTPMEFFVTYKLRNE